MSNNSNQNTSSISGSIRPLSDMQSSASLLEASGAAARGGSGGVAANGTTSSSSHGNRGGCSISSNSLDPEIRGDPRMNRAVEAKLRNPGISLSDALKAGGFKYPPKATASVLDEENVTLGQRKNQLNRRLRQARLNQNSKAAGGGPSETGASIHNTVVPAQSVGSTGVGAASGLGQGGFSFATSSNMGDAKRQKLGGPLSAISTPSNNSGGSHTRGAQQQQQQQVGSSAGDGSSSSMLSLQLQSLLSGMPPPATSSQQGTTSGTSHPLSEQLMHMRSLQELPQPHLLDGEQQQLQPQQSQTQLLQQLLQQQAQRQQQPQQQQQTHQDSTTLQQLQQQFQSQQQGQQQPPTEQAASALAGLLSPQVSGLLIQQMMNNSSAVNMNNNDNNNTTNSAPTISSASVGASGYDYLQPLAEQLQAAVMAAQQQQQQQPSFQAQGSSSINNLYNNTGTIVSASSHGNPNSAVHSSNNNSSNSSGNNNNNSNIISNNIINNVLANSSNLHHHQDNNSSPDSNNEDDDEDERLDLGLEIFGRELRRLYQQAMLQAGYPAAQTQEDSPTFRNFAFCAWRRESRHLQHMLRTDMNMNMNLDNPHHSMTTNGNGGATATAMGAAGLREAQVLAPPLPSSVPSLLGNSSVGGVGSDGTSTMLTASQFELYATQLLNNSNMSGGGNNGYNGSGGAGIN